jgi:Ca2+-binding EF-hand superfamily protein
LDEHERFLKEFNMLFKEVDQDQNGIINDEEFRELILGMNVVVQNLSEANKDVDTLLKVINPHGNQQMTYSEVVQLLSNQMVPK